MRRRAVLAGFLAATAATVAPCTRATADGTRRIGYLSGGGPKPQGLAELLAPRGWVDGKNLHFETRIAASGSDAVKMRAAAEELVRARVDVLLGWTDRADALAAATKTIPIVAGGHPDPVGLGLAKSLREPGGNVTGLSAGFRETASAELGILRAFRPQLSRIAIVHGEQGEARMRLVFRFWREMAAPLGISIAFAPCATAADVARAFDRLGDPISGAAVLVFGGMTTVALPKEISKEVHELAVRRRIATMANPQQGGLMSYYLSHSDETGRIAVIVDKILRGQKAGEIPFELPDRTHFTINRTTAKAIGVTLTPELLVRATQVID